MNFRSPLTPDVHFLKSALPYAKMQLISVIALGVPLLTSFVRTATIGDIAASNLALAQQCISTDEAVVAITADTSPTTAQVPTRTLTLEMLC